MKLDFSALSQPAPKARGQVGTAGTQATTRVCASPLAQDGAGTTGDKPAVVALAAELVVAIPASCPPVSPACPQAADDEKLNAGAVSPVSPVVPAETAQVAAAAPIERQDLTDAEAFEERAAIMEFDGGLPRADAEEAARQCVDCEHFGRRRTCFKPQATEHAADGSSGSSRELQGGGDSGPITCVESRVLPRLTPSAVGRFGAP